MELVARQEERTRIKADSLLAHSVPLIGQSGSPRLFVSKADMIETAQADAARVVARVQNAGDIDVQRLTGHFMRRGGAKALARAGTPIALIKPNQAHVTAQRQCSADLCRGGPGGVPERTTHAGKLPPDTEADRGPPRRTSSLEESQDD